MNRTHCDGPDCEFTTHPDDPTWYVLDFGAQTISERWPKHFCTRQCLASWADPGRAGRVSSD